MSIFSKIKKTIVTDDSLPEDKKQAKKAEVKAEKKETKDSAKKTEAKKVAARQTGEAYKVLVKPLISEKSSLMSQENKYVFEVGIDATKNEVKKAIKSVYNVLPEKVNIVSMKGKKVRFKRVLGRRKDWKKAIITLKKGDKIDVYEGV